MGQGEGALRPKAIYAEALQYGTQALSAASYPDWVFGVGVYAALAGDPKLALRRIEEAIQQSPDLFVRAATDPELDSIRKQIWKMLGKMAVEMARLVEQRLTEATKVANTLRKKESLREYPDGVSRLAQVLDLLTARSKNPSYASHRWVADELKTLDEALEGVASASHEEAKWMAQQEKCEKLRAAYTAMESERKKLEIENERLSRENNTATQSLQQASQDYNSSIILECMLTGVIISYILAGIYTGIRVFMDAKDVISGFFESIFGAVFWPILFISVFDKKYSKYVIPILLVDVFLISMPILLCLIKNGSYWVLRSWYSSAFARHVPPQPAD